MGKTSATVKNRWNKKMYDRVLLVVPKGKKEMITQRAREKGMSVNGYLSSLVRTDLGLTEAEWKARGETEE